MCSLSPKQSFLAIFPIHGPNTVTQHPNASPVAGYRRYLPRRFVSFSSSLGCTRRVRFPSSPAVPLVSPPVGRAYRFYLEGRPSLACFQLQALVNHLLPTKALLSFLIVVHSIQSQWQLNFLSLQAVRYAAAMTTYAGAKLAKSSLIAAETTRYLTGMPTNTPAIPSRKPRKL